MDKMYLESALRYILGRSGIEQLKYPVSPPMPVDIKITFDFSRKEKNAGGRWIVPCAMASGDGSYNRTYYAVVKGRGKRLSRLFDLKKDAEIAVEELIDKDPFGAVPAGSPVEKPLDKIDPREIKQILIMENRKAIMEAKLGETVIDVWPLVSGLRKKYPEAVIHIVSDFPGAFEGKIFKGKIRPLTKDKAEEIYSSREKRIGYLEENDIDMVFEIGRPAMNFYDTGPVDFGDLEMPYIFEVNSPMGWTSAISPSISIIGGKQSFRDRQGRRYYIPFDKQDFLEGIAAPSYDPSISGATWKLDKAGIWALAMRNSCLFGLDVNADNLLSIGPTPDETVGALRWLEEEHKRSSGGETFDPTRKIIVVNVYAVTQQNLVPEDVWVDLITNLIENVKGAYLVFPHGGEMDKDVWYVDRIVRKVRQKFKARGVAAETLMNGNEMILPRQDIYPHMQSLLGITDAVITLDTGLSHLANGVYDIPTVVITSGDILQWMVPRDNATAVIGKPGMMHFIGMAGMKVLQERLIEEIESFAKEINRKEERPLAKLAKAAAVWVRRRAELDRDLLENYRIDCPEAEEDLRDFIIQVMKILDVPLKIMPEIVFVDSSPQTEMGIPRFSIKLATFEKGRSYLLVDKSTLYDPLEPGSRLAVEKEEAQNRALVRYETKVTDTLHEIMGHLLIRSVFEEFKETHFNAMRIDMSVERYTERDTSLRYVYDYILKVKTEEEVLARIMTILAAKEISSRRPDIINADILRSLEDIGIDLGAGNMFDNLDAILDWTGKGKALSTLRYNETLAKHRDDIKKDILMKYKPAMERMRFFGMRKHAQVKEEERSAEAASEPFFRNIQDARMLAEDMARAAISIDTTKKMVLVFDRDVGGAYRQKIAEVIEELEEALKNVLTDEAISDLEIVWAPASRIREKVGEYSDIEEAEIFVFANAQNRESLSDIEGRVHSVYINDKGFEINAYYPLPQIVAITLAQYLDPSTISQVRPVMDKLNIADIRLSEKDGTLVFTLLPDAEPMDEQELIRELANLKRFLKSA
ncbi:MAG: hypothetical protein GF408_03030 [Candidatus Omnitrophica bacterium]|nr:hypothetical protein [Candidatus Omnitrophota bacterium]